ncbi:hypothetical protein F4677DRAFT_453796 [Hypoxylon crocopeplum]|nr:hypothetical protein F4677DRAFT_453796 [Hypoxylon crocopeplum]
MLTFRLIDGSIGSALALISQQRGLHIFAAVRDPSKMTSLKGLSNVTLLTLKPADIQAAVKAVTKQTGGTLNYLINNAGRNHFVPGTYPYLDEDLDTVRKLFKVNFFAPIALTQTFAPLLIKVKGMAVATYSASKRSIETVAKTLRLELAPFGVDVLEAVTGAVKSEGQTCFGDFRLPDGVPRMDTMEYVAVVVNEIAKRTTGRFWHGNNVDAVKMSTTATTVPQSTMDAGASAPIKPSQVKQRHSLDLSKPS